MDREEKQTILALIDDNSEIVTTILELSNSVNIQLSLKTIEIPALLTHEPPLISVAIFLNAIRCISALLVHKSNLSITDSLGRCPIHFAAACGNIDILDLLAHEHANLLATDAKGRNILHFAAKFGHVHVLQWITAKRLRLAMTDEQGFTPLHFAAESGNLSVMSHLLEMDSAQRASANGVILICIGLLFSLRRRMINLKLFVCC
jgi:ankyrin repeat protein